MTPTPAIDARATERSPMAHRALRSAPRTAPAAPRAAVAGPGAAATRVGRQTTSPIMAAVAAEAGGLVASARRVVPNRRVALLLGLAVLAVLALGGMAGAAEPKPVNRS